MRRTIKGGGRACSSAGEERWRIGVMFSSTVSTSWMTEEEPELVVLFFDRSGDCLFSKEVESCEVFSVGSKKSIM